MEWDGRKPPVISRQRPGRSWLWAGLLAMTLAGAAVLYHFDPARTWFYPPCMFHALTGLNCPGCGGLRAIHKLLHGNVTGALHSNALVVLLVPIVLWVGVRVVWQTKAGVRQADSPVPIPLLWIVLGAMIVFGLLRNLPVEQFAWMSP